MMTRKELKELVPGLVDDILENRLSPEMQELLQLYPDVQQELDIAVQVRQFLVELQAELTEVHVSSDFEARLLARVCSPRDGPELLSLSPYFSLTIAGDKNNFARALRSKHRYICTMIAIYGIVHSILQSGACFLEGGMTIH